MNSTNLWIGAAIGSSIIAAIDYRTRGMMMAKMRKVVQERLLGFEEVQQMVGRLIVVELNQLVKNKTIDIDTADKIAISLSKKMNNWEIWPPKRQSPIPDPNEIKAAIRIRLTTYTKVQLPDVKKPSRLEIALAKLR